MCACPQGNVIAPVAPLFDPSELGGIIPTDGRTQFDVRKVLARVLDGSRLDEFKPLYGNTLVTGGRLPLPHPLPPPPSRRWATPRSVPSLGGL